MLVELHFMFRSASSYATSTDAEQYRVTFHSVSRLWLSVLLYNYLDKICKCLCLVTDESKDVSLVGELNIDWFSKNSLLHKKLMLIV